MKREREARVLRMLVGKAVREAMVRRAFAAEFEEGRVRRVGAVWEKDVYERP